MLCVPENLYRFLSLFFFRTNVSPRSCDATYTEQDVPPPPGGSARKKQAMARKPSGAHRQRSARTSESKTLEPDNYQSFRCAACMVKNNADKNTAAMEAPNAVDTVECSNCNVRVHHRCYGVSKKVLAGEYYALHTVSHKHMYLVLIRVPRGASSRLLVLILTCSKPGWGRVG